MTDIANANAEPDTVWGTHSETFYVAPDGGTWLVQGPDMLGPDPVAVAVVPDVPPTARELDEQALDQEMRDTIHVLRCLAGRVR
ncbi:MAG TPA: hypothetical protein VK607_10500 [Kofleriaceae bacterium]|nr:hypothetical protein [Kofleriaceae bacterium]